MTLEELKTKKVFISYGHDSFLPVARQLAKDLSEYVHSVWFDEKDIHSATVWTDEIEKGLENCDFVLALMTKHAYRKPAGVCVNEIVYASNKKKNICPVLVQEMDVPLILCSIQYFNIVDAFNEITGEINQERYQEKFQGLINQLLKGSFDYTGYLRDLKSYLNPQNKLNEHAALTPNYVGRRWLDKKYDEWVKSSSSTLFIVGKPGCGKSAFSTHLCLTRPEIKGIHYCEYNDCSSTSLTAIIKTLAFYLLNEFNDYRELFSDIDLGKLDSLSIDDLFSTLIKTPIRKMAGKEYNKVVVVVVDALDELKGKDVTKLLHLFSTFKNEMPSWFKLLFTSRPNPAYLKELEAFHPIEIELTSKDNVDDIKEYLLSSNANLTEEEMDIIVERSGGVFQYAKNVVEELENNPDYDLSRLPIGLVGKYDEDFDKYFNHESFKDYSPIFEVVSASKEPMNRNMIEEIVDDDYLLGESLNKLQAYLIAQDGKIAFFHKSIFDWLTDKESGRYYVSVKAGEKLICNYLKENVNQEFWRRNEYVVKYGFAHLYERKEFRAIAEVLSINRGGIIDRFCYYVSSLIFANSSSLESCFSAIIDECSCYEYVFARLIKMLIEKGLFDECSSRVVELVEDDIPWAEKYFELCKNRPLSNFDKIKELYEQIVPLIKDESVLNEIFDYVGDAYRLTGDFDRAIYFYGRIIDSVKEKDRVQKCFFSMYNFLDVKYVKGYVNEARTGMEKILTQLDPESDPYKFCKANRLLGNVAYQSGNAELARKYYSTSYELAKEINRPLTQAEALESIAKTYVGTDNEKARALNLEARNIAQRYNFVEIFAKTYYPEATSYLEDGNYEKALEVALIGEKKNFDIKYLTGTARMRRYVARAHYGLGNYEKALEYAILSVKGYKESQTYPISRMKSYVILLKSAKALGKLSEYAHIDSLEDIYYHELPNAEKYIQQINELLKNSTQS